MKTSRTVFYVFIALFLSVPYLAVSQDDDSASTSDPNAPTVFQHLYADDGHVPLMKIHTSVKELMKNKSRTEEYYIPGKVSISQSDGSELEFDMEIKVRGNTRKKVCKFPPFKLNLGKGELAEKGFNSEVDKLKLVMQCESSDRNFQQLLKEMVIYDMYELIDTNSMRGKLIKTEFYEDGELVEELNAFLVEDEDEYSHRKNAKIIEKGRINAHALPRDQYFKLCFFQYMIANCDWSVANKHNIEIVGLTEPRVMVAVPYDFDYAGFVDNHYAVPPEHFPIDNVTQRYFMVKQEMTPEEIEGTVAYFQDMKDGFLAACSGREGLTEKTSNGLKNFVESFYKELGNTKRLTRLVKPK